MAKKSTSNRTTLPQGKFNMLRAAFPELSEAEISAGFNYVQNLAAAGVLEATTINDLGKELRAKSIPRPANDALLINRFARKALDFVAS